MAYLESTLQNGSYGSGTEFASIYDSIARKPQAYAELLQEFGEALNIFNFVNLAGQVIPVTTPNLKIIEEGAPERLVTVSIPTVAAGTDPTLTFASSDNSDTYVREHFDLIIPPAYTNAGIEVPLNLYYDGSNWRGKWYDSTYTITSTVTNKEFAIGASAMGYGSDGVDPMFRGFYERYTDERIMREANGLEGAQLYQEDFYAVEMANGKQGLLSKGLVEMDFRLDSQMDAALFVGQKNANTGFTSTSLITGNSSTVPSADGLIQTCKDFSLSLPWTSAFDITKFEALKGLLESVGVYSRDVDFFVGTRLNNSIMKGMQSYLNTNSGGTNLYQTMGDIGFKVGQVTYNNVTSNVMELVSLSNPNKFGGSEYGFADMGFIFPKGKNKVTMNGDELKLAHLTLGYPKGKGEDRQRIIKPINGVTNIIGAPAANAYDGLKYHALTHIVPIWTHMKKTIFVSK